MNNRALKLALVGAVVLGGLVYAFYPRGYCEWAKGKYGFEIAQCPEGKVRQVLEIRGSGLRRNGPGTVYLSGSALYTVAKADTWLSEPVVDFDATLSLVDAAGKETPVPTNEKGKTGDGWKREGGQKIARVVLPPVPDGDYALRASVKSRVATSVVDLPLALYAPAKIHIITDRPLYEAGNDVQFRALVLRANDLSPIDHRAGRWLVRNPQGEILLEEKAEAGEWGVVAGSFPLDSEAAEGTWTVSWSSGGTEGSASFRVEPFTLPRFRVEATPDKPFYGRGDTPVVTGAVIYSSGAPVASAALVIDWTVTGAWPPPASWAKSALPKEAVAGSDGRFELTLPGIPPDLQGQVRLIARITAVDPAGDRVVASTTLLLSRDAIQVQAVTELQGGLVEGFNNRVFLRVTTADGRPLPGATLNIKRAWARADTHNAIDAQLDADAVARVQLDPGPPVNVVIPAAPYRAPPRGKIVRRVSAFELASSRQPSLADQIAMDTWNSAIAACSKWSTISSSGQSANAKVVLRVNESGAVVASDAGNGPLNACVLNAVRKRRLSRGKPRLYSIGYSIASGELPVMTARLSKPLGAPNELQGLFNTAALDARDCIPAGARAINGKVPWRLAWQIRAGSKKLSVSWMKTAGGDAMPPRLAACIMQRVSRRKLDKAAENNRIGLVDFSIALPDKGRGRRKPQPTIMKGYELLVSATRGAEELGETTLRMHPGTVPPLRLRATPVVAKAGEKVIVELLRGPDYQGEVPEKVFVDHLGTQTDVDVDRKKRTAEVTLPADAKGWFQISAGGYRTLVFVRSSEDLTVKVTSEKPSYAPGDGAKIAIQTAIGGRGAKAAVGLFGVDQSLAQIAKLRGADDLRSVRPEVPMSAPAFGVLEGQALALGRIRGANAAEATVLQVASIPSPAELDVVLDGSAESHFDPVAELTTRFYPILSELHAQTRIWETSAPAEEMMEPATMARLWTRALDAMKKRGEPIDDAFGRALRLHRLPRDLLELTDPRQVVVVGTRLPEDIENWPDWVAKRRP